MQDVDMYIYFSVFSSVLSFILKLEKIYIYIERESRNWKYTVKY